MLLPLEWIWDFDLPDGENASGSGLYLDVDQEYFDDVAGVYLIFYETDSRNDTAVKVGRGNIREEIRRWRNHPDIITYHAYGLRVVWAKVKNLDLLDGMAKYLTQKLGPLVEEEFPECSPVAVNLPFTS